MSDVEVRLHLGSFSGPLFIVGLPRSGTKLLRDLLNQHPRIGITTVESHFLPFMMARFGESPNFENEQEFSRFFSEFTRTPFYWNMCRQGRRLDDKTLTTTADLMSWSSIFEAILKFYAPSGKRMAGFIWGDKTPGYVNHMPLLKDLFPRAKFLHIIRDPRDYCLSVQKTWGKHMYRAADTWRRTLEKRRPEGQRLGHSYKEVHYEALLSDPLGVLSEVCLFLGCEFTPTMTSLDEPAENLGDARGSKVIVRDNTKKYRTQLSLNQIQRIEEIVYPVAVDLDYDLEYATSFNPVDQLMLKVFKLYDGWASMMFHIREKGLCQGFSYFYRLHQRSSWH
jgi:hypothetical protein